MKNTTSSIIGTFTGECADSTITNLNGLDITREVWETVFSSDEYRKGIKLGHFIGFLGHPAEPDCQNFQEACIVMTDGYIDDDGKVYGTFNLVDTPVGRVVKSFIDAGVTFGISVRGAGDIVDNSVDPDTFVFRGFDLVAFPAYPDAIPEFKPIAASSTGAARKQYRAVCAAVRNNISEIKSVSALNILQKCVAAQSAPAEAIKARISELTYDPNKKLNAITDMYVAATAQLRSERSARLRAAAAADARIRRIQAIMSSQQRALEAQLTQLESEYRSTHSDLSCRLQAAQRTNSQLSTKLTASRSMQRQLEDTIDTNKKQIRQLRSKVQACARTIDNLNSELSINASRAAAAEKQNLIYNRQLDTATEEAQQHRDDLSEIQAQMRETVTASRHLESTLSNRDREIAQLQAQFDAVSKNLSDYQTAYAQLYASAVGSSTSVNITASTTVDDLARQINAAQRIVDQPTGTEFADVYIGDDDDLTTM